MSVEESTGCLPPRAGLPMRIDPASPHRDYRLERLIARLPPFCQNALHWLRRPSARWARLPVGFLLIAGGCLAILPVFGLWMIPVGLFLLAEDMPPLRRLRERLLAAAERRWPQMFAAQ